MPVGHPTDYDPAFCESVIEYGKAGKSVTWIASELGVVRQTLYNWMSTHPQFLDAMTHAKQYAQRWWEDAGQDGMKNAGFNASIWSRSMAARFPDDWREIKGTELTGRDGGAVETVTRIELIAVDADDHGTD